MSQKLPSHRVIPQFLLLLFGVICGSTAVIMIKASDEHPLLVAAYRLLVAAIVLLPFFLRDLALAKEDKPTSPPYSWQMLGWTLPPAIALAIHFMSWVIGARMTQVANASLIANMTPVVMPFFVWILFRERINRQEIIGTVFTLAGLLLLTGSNLSVSKTNFTGDVICFGSMIAFAAYLALGRKNGARISLWLYMVPLYAISGLICLITALFFVNPIKPYSQMNILLILGLGIVPTVLVHTIFNSSLKLFPGQVVSVTNLTQPVFATLLGFLIFAEKPRPIFYLAAAIIIGGVLIVLDASRTKYQQEAEAASREPGG
jgi:drug/metabolite transporter (DMT)-like permease